MKNLKKLTRKGLDELAKQMPEMKVAEQSECVGAYRYYWNNGDGSKESSITLGPSEEIRIVNTLGMSIVADGYHPDERPDIPGASTSILLPSTQSGFFDKMVQKQILDKLDSHGLNSGVVVNQNSNYFGLWSCWNWTYSQNDYKMHIYLPSDNCDNFTQDWLEYCVDGVQDWYDSGLILRQQGQL